MIRRIALLAAVGCARPVTAPPPAVALPEVPAPSPAAPEGPPVGPGIVSAPPLEIRIPDGWRGHRGPDGTGLLLRIAHARLGTEVEVWSFPRNGPPHPRPRAGCDDLFVDSGDTRALPGLPVAVTRSCIDEGGSLVQGWVAVVGDREIHVEVRHPPGTAYEGRVAVAPVLEGLAIGAAEPATRLR